MGRVQILHIHDDPDENIQTHLRIVQATGSAQYHWVKVGVNMAVRIGRAVTLLPPDFFKLKVES